MDKIYIDKLSKWHNKLDIIKSLLKDNSLDIEFFYKSKFENTKDLRDFVDSICLLLNFSDKLKSRIVLISDELNNNAIEYWSDLNALNVLRISAQISEWEVNFKMEVEDNGKWKSPKNALDMETMRAHKLRLGYFWHDSIRWRWLFLIIVKIVDRLYFKNSQDGWLIVWIKMKI